MPSRIGPRCARMPCALRTSCMPSRQCPSLPRRAAEVVEFLRWLADDHFTFLGYREYRLVDDDGVEALAAVSGTGLGILRADKLRPRPLADLPAEVRARVRDPQLLLITKANSRSTVHRGVYLDYIGIKTFDKSGVVIGERRFLGLFTSVAYTQSVWRIPLLQKQVVGGARTFRVHSPESQRQGSHPDHRGSPA